MIHPSYVELMKVVNNDVEIGEEPVVIKGCRSVQPEHLLQLGLCAGHGAA